VCLSCRSWLRVRGDSIRFGNDGNDRARPKTASSQNLSLTPRTPIVCTSGSGLNCLGPDVLLGPGVIWAGAHSVCREDPPPRGVDTVVTNMDQMPTDFSM
jgi:hypothetical protein